jgi:MFS family permease
VDGPRTRPSHTRTIERTWAAGDPIAGLVAAPRDDVVLERRDGEGRFTQAGDGWFTVYERRVAPTADGSVTERTTYRITIPWFTWLFTIPVRLTLARRIHTGRRGTPWWSPPDRLNPRQLDVIGLLAAVSMSSAFINTLFTQTAEFAADDFGVGKSGVGIGGAIVRAGIVLVLPIAALGDRVGRRRVIVTLAYAAPIVSSLGAIAPSYRLLVASQTLGRPLGLALDFMIAVVAAEEMPRNSRAYAVSVLAMASGLGSGVAVGALPLADLAEGSWRLVYLFALVWVVVAVGIAGRLPETHRFERPHVVAPPLDRRRFGVLAAIALLGNLFIAPASLFQNGYLEDERGFSATMIAIFTLVTATPAAIGLVVGGRVADLRGRRRIVAVAVPTGAAFLVVSYSVGGPPMWFAVVLAASISGIAFPALAVYRTELFPTGNRSRAAGLLTAAGLVGGIGGLVLMGQLLDHGYSHGAVIGALACAQLATVIVFLAFLPETAHRELEELNPLDAPPATLQAELPTADGARLHHDDRRTGEHP